MAKDIGALIWHLECKRLALTTLDTFVPPADSFTMRMHHSLYIVNLMSAIDMINEYFDTNFYQFLQSELNVNGTGGENVLSYIRELRNGIVHRGEDPTRIGTVVNGVVRAVAPETVSNRKGITEYRAPFFLLRELFEHLEITVGPAMMQTIRPYINQPDDRPHEDILREMRVEMDKISIMPEWAKNMVSANLTPEMLKQVSAHNDAKLVDLLSPAAMIN